MKYEVTKNNVHIEDSYAVQKSQFGVVLDYLRENYPDSDVWKRTNLSMKLEWAVHNFLYRIEYKPSRTKDVDLDYPQKWYMRAAYDTLGVLCWLFIK